MTGSKLRDRSILVVTFLVVLAAILIGCGGGGNSGSNTVSGSGSASGGATGSTSGASGSSMVFSIEWPASTRGIPSYANSVVLTVQNGSAIPVSQTINRGSKIAYTQKVTFPGLAAGNYFVTGQAYLDNDAQGPIVADFSATLVVAPNAEVDAPVSFASTVASVVIDGAPIFMETGITTQLTGHAVDINENILLLPVGSLQWTITKGAGLVEVTTAGFLSAIEPGDVTVQLKDLTSGATTTADITVTGEALTTGATTGTTTDTTGGSTTTDSTTTDGGSTDTTGGTTDTTGTTGGTTDTTGDTGGTGGSGGTVSTGGTGIG